MSLGGSGNFLPLLVVVLAAPVAASVGIVFVLEEEVAAAAAAAVAALASSLGASVAVEEEEEVVVGSVGVDGAESLSGAGELFPTPLVCSTPLLKLSAAAAASVDESDVVRRRFRDSKSAAERERLRLPPGNTNAGSSVLSHAKHNANVRERLVNR